MMDFGEVTCNKRRARRPWLLLVPVVVLLLVSLGGGAAVWALPPLKSSGGADPAGAAGGAIGGDGGAGLRQLAGSSSKPVDILLMGVDREWKGPTRADAIILVRVNPDTGELAMLSIPRDFWVEIEPGRKARINASYANGGPEESIAAVEDLTGVDVDHYAVADLKGFQKLVDALGGVKVGLDGNLPRDWGDEPGVKKLNGQQALFYARYRGTPGADLDRIQRQRELLAALRSEALDWGSLRKLPKMAGIVREHLETDMSAAEMLSLGRGMMQNQDGAIMTSDQLEGEPDTLPDGKQVLIPNRKANAGIVRDYRR